MADGLGVISYLSSTGSDLRVAHCVNVTCTAATLATVDSVGNVGFYSSITVGPDGLPLIVYHQNTLALKVAHCGNASCSPFVVRRR